MTTRLEKQRKRYDEEKKKKKIEGVKWDKKDTITSSALVLLIVLLLIAFNIDFKAYYLENNPNWAIACGKITDMESFDVMEQTKGGNRFTIGGYLIKYIYQIDNILYMDSIYFSSRMRFGSIPRIGDSRKVYYKKTDHTKSHINLNSPFDCE